MPANTLSHYLPLPRGWPRRVRSAVVHVISLARTSLALTQGWASESMNGQLRQRADGDRLQAEIQLLREEIRLKNARMEQLGGPVHRSSISETQDQPKCRTQFRWTSTRVINPEGYRGQEGGLSWVGTAKTRVP